jgi:hypothetical protein
MTQLIFRKDFGLMELPGRERPARVGSGLPLHAR